MMIVLVLHLLALLSSVTGLCYSPVLHGFAPDVILPSVLSSEIYCPHPHVFDHFVCMCVDASVVRVQLPTAEGRTSLELSGLVNRQRLPSSPPTFRLASPVAGLPDMHVPGSSHRWPSVSPFQLTSSGGSSSNSGSSNSGSSNSGGGLSRRVVPVLNPYGSFNLPAKAKLVKDSSKVAEAAPLPSATKQRELLEKVRWREQLQREASVVAAAEMAAAAAAAAAAATVPVSAGGQSTLDLFMRDTLRRILYGY